jgi:hypothetical protein
MQVYWQARRDSNPQHPVLETGALAVRATGLHEKKTTANRGSPYRCLLGFLVRSVNPAKTAILLELELLRRVFLVFCRRVIPVLTFCAGKGDYVSHVNLPFIAIRGDDLSSGHPR